MTTATKTPALTLSQAKKIIATQAAEIETLKARPVRDRGPLSQRTMNEADAHEILLGNRKGDSHRKCAEDLGLSYGQIYSARNGFTFKAVYKTHRDAVVKAESKAAAKANK